MARLLLPHQVLERQPYDTAADAWSVGATIYRILTGNVPYPKGYSRGSAPPTPIDASRFPRAAPLVAALMRVDPSSRPTMSDIMMSESVRSALRRDRAAQAATGYGVLAIAITGAPELKTKGVSCADTMADRSIGGLGSPHAFPRLRSLASSSPRGPLGWSKCAAGGGGSFDDVAAAADSRIHPAAAYPTPPVASVALSCSTSTPVDAAKGIRAALSPPQPQTARSTRTSSGSGGTGGRSAHSAAQGISSSRRTLGSLCSSPFGPPLSANAHAHVESATGGLAIRRSDAWPWDGGDAPLQRSTVASGNRSGGRAPPAHLFSADTTGPLPSASVTMVGGDAAMRCTLEPLQGAVAASLCVDANVAGEEESRRTMQLASLYCSTSAICASSTAQHRPHPNSQLDALARSRSVAVESLRTPLLSGVGACSSRAARQVAQPQPLLEMKSETPPPPAPASPASPLPQREARRRRAASPASPSPSPSPSPVPVSPPLTVQRWPSRGRRDLSRDAAAAAAAGAGRAPSRCDSLPSPTGAKGRRLSVPHIGMPAAAAECAAHAQLHTTGLSVPLKPKGDADVAVGALVGKAAMSPSAGGGGHGGGMESKPPPNGLNATLRDMLAFVRDDDW